MPKFMVKACYNAAGAKGLLKEGATSRLAAVRNMTEGLGGKVESFYYAYGETDVYAVIDAPDSATMIAFSLAINSSGLTNITTIPLISVEEVDEAAKKTVEYRPPGA